MRYALRFAGAVLMSVTWPVVFVVWLIGDEPLPPVIVGPLLVYMAVASWSDLLEVLLNRKRAELQALKTLGEISDTLDQMRGRK
jgi:hypothetical protein